MTLTKDKNSQKKSQNLFEIKFFQLQQLSIQESFYLLAISLLIIFNFFISFIVRTQNVYFIPNTRPFGISFDNVTIILILSFITWSLDTLNFFDKYNLASVLLIVGAWSNFLERIYFGAVADYVNFFVSYINLADVQIWVGLIILNWQIWILRK